MIIEAAFVEHLAEVEDEVPQLTTAIVIGDAPTALKRIAVVPYAQLAAGPALAAAHPSRPLDLASVVHTSGTSGPAKPVLLTHAANMNGAGQIVRGLRLTRKDVYYCAHPMFHMAGKSQAVIAQLLGGGSVVLDSKFTTARLIERIDASGATCDRGARADAANDLFRGAHFAGPSDRASARPACPLPKRIAAAFEQRFGVLGIEAYGMTEIGIPAIRPMDEPLKVGSCGRIDRERYEVRITDPDTDAALPPEEVGQILIRPTKDWILLQGYAGMPEATVAAWRNLWFHTGDAGLVDAEGHLHYIDRLGDRIRRRAESISSYDIEAAAIEFPGLLEAAVVGVPLEFELDDDIKLYMASGTQAIA